MFELAISWDSLYMVCILCLVISQIDLVDSSIPEYRIFLFHSVGPRRLKSKTGDTSHRSLQLISPGIFVSHDLTADNLRRWVPGLSNQPAFYLMHSGIDTEVITFT